MKRSTQFSRCKICGKDASVVRWWTKARSGKIYYYLRYQHSGKNFHLVPTDSSYTNFPVVKNKAKDIYLVLEDYVVERMGDRRFRYVSLVRELTRLYKINIYNEEFNRALKKLISRGLVSKEKKGRETMYIKVTSGELIPEISFDRMTIAYDIGSKKVKTNVFLEVINNADTPLKEIPFYIPAGMLDSLNVLRLKGEDEVGSIPNSRLTILLSQNVQTQISILLNRTLRRNEHEWLHLSYELPKDDDLIRFTTPVRVDSLRVTVSSDVRYELLVERILADGVKNTVLPFQRKCLSSSIKNCLETELDKIMEGESISVKVNEI